MTDEVFKQFEIKCKNCGSTDIDFSFYSGFVHDCGGDAGSLTISCNTCGNKIEE